jgi:hypothetical protein
MSQIEPEEAFEELAQNILGRVNVALPGVVESYDESTNTATVRPAVRLHRIDEDTEERIAERHPAIPQVPVARPQFGSYFELECPLQAGDHVLLLVCDRSIDGYVQTGNADNIPQDVRRFDWSDAVALPVWVRSHEQATARVVVATDGTITVEGTNVKLGASAIKAVALAPDVATNLTAIATTLSPLAAAWAATQPAGGPVTAPPATPIVPYTPTSTASTKVTSE